MTFGPGWLLRRTNDYSSLLVLPRVCLHPPVQCTLLVTRHSHTTQHLQTGARGGARFFLKLGCAVRRALMEAAAKRNQSLFAVGEVDALASAGTEAELLGIVLASPKLTTWFADHLSTQHARECWICRAWSNML